ncbi:MAG TPA: sensor histidine kinase [Firmicutes bacterium]|nr:sensor histidine kinase [Bacillota bacterium]
MQKIATYLKQVSQERHIGIKLFNDDLSHTLLVFPNPNGSRSSFGNWIPVRAAKHRLLFQLEVNRVGKLYLTLLSPAFIKGLYFLLFIFCMVFFTLTLHFHIKITKPLQLLSTRLKNVKIGNSSVSLYSKRKDEIGELYQYFNQMEQRLYQAHQEQINMIAAMAHDLKTPLTSINGFVELLALQKNLSEKEKQEYYDLIAKKSRHMVELINSFSAFTRDELELETHPRERVEVKKLFERIAAEYETELSSLNFRLHWNHSFKGNQYLCINEHMIRRVFGNLFSNAVRYGEKPDLQVYLSGFIQGNSVYFQVEDNGQGVPDQDLASLFMKFFTVDKSRQTKKGGTGLGLSSCKSIVEHHGGQIEAFHSEYGGLAIRFSIPLAR